MSTINVGKVGTLLTKRPEDMSYEDYRKARKGQDVYLKGYNAPIPGTDKVTHVMGRLEGVLIPSKQYKNGRDPQVVIK